MGDSILEDGKLEWLDKERNQAMALNIFLKNIIMMDNSVKEKEMDLVLFKLYPKKNRWFIVDSGLMELRMDLENKLMSLKWNMKENGNKGRSMVSAK